MKKTSVIWGIVFLLCLAALPSIEYIGGRLCMPLIVPPLFPAQIVPAGIGLFAAVKLVGAVIRSLLARQHRIWTLGALTIAVAAAGTFWLCAPHLPGFLHGLRDRFVVNVGYIRMREFAREVSQTGEEAIIGRPGKWSPATPEKQKQWEDLIARYPFVGWGFGYGTIVVRGGIVHMSWGSALTGHWGFDVALKGTVHDLETHRRRALQAADDIQFVYFD